MSSFATNAVVAVFCAMTAVGAAGDVALQPDAAVTSANLFDLIEERETNIAKADQLWRVDQTSSLDPMAARQLITDTILAADRLRPLLPNCRPATSK